MRRTLTLWLLAGALLAVLPATVLARGDTNNAIELPVLDQGRAIRYGARGEPVLALQKLLGQAGFDPGKQDGIYGPLTEAAVRKAQASLGLEADGLAGRLTLDGLNGRLTPPAARQQPAAEEEPPPSGMVVYRAGEPASAIPAIWEETAESTPIPAVDSVRPQPFALTFQGTPDSDLTDRLLETLQQHGMQATFFIEGETAAANPALIARIAADGHEIANHGFVNLDMTRLSDEMMGAQLRAAQRRIEEAVGQAPAYFRPPQGRFSQRLSQAAEAMGLRMVLWTNVGVRDLAELAADELAQHLSEEIFPGAVLMLRQDRPNSIASLERLLEVARAKGYQGVTLSKLLPPAGSTAYDR